MECVKLLSARPARGFDVVAGNLSNHKKAQQDRHTFGDGAFAESPTPARAGIGANKGCRPSL
jgi:hypothetical protein